MTEEEAQGRMIGDVVEYQGQPATIVRVHMHQGLGRDPFRASFHIKTADGADYHDVDYRLLTLVATT
jgi:hypothetical protein